ncbi:MAG: DUF951 domain-containing protein [Anaerolineales bacterium]
MLPDTPLKLDDLLQLRKPHPCGGYVWRVTRLGADIGIQCTTCQRQQILARRELAQRVKKILSNSRENHAQS